MSEKTEKSEKIEMTGQVKNIIFRSEQNGYTVFKIKTPEEIIVCTGYFAELNENENINVTGNFVVHPTYGLQFKISYIEKKIPVTQDNIKKYLASGIIKGIGPKIAERIVNLFGVNTFDIIENDYINLTKVSGISEKLASNINKTFVKLNKTRNIMLYLQSLDITPAYAARIQKYYGDDTINLININPYRLTDEIWGIGFKKADEIAKKIGIEKDSDFRIQAAIKFCLNQASELGGHIFLPEEMLISETINLLIDIDQDLIQENINNLCENNLIFREKINNQIVDYINFYYHMEKYVAQKILILNQKKLAQKDLYLKLKNNINIIIKKFLLENKIELADQQYVAVAESILNGVTIITGGPGTGKTTTLKIIIGVLKLLGFYVELCAPTGRAAKRMSEATNCEAKTIHRLLEINFSRNEMQGFKHNQDNPIKADYIIIDESSMVDLYLMYSLLKAVAPGTRLILVGDADQLPSVGAGDVLNDLIKSQAIKVIRLDKIFRQSDTSSIVSNAHKINNGVHINLSQKSDDFFFINQTDPDSIINIILELLTKKDKNNIDLSEVQILSPMRRTALGTINLNKILQEHLNPSNKSKSEKNFGLYTLREGDKVMQIKNDYALQWRCIENNICVSNGLGVFNGDIGFIKLIDNLNSKIVVQFDENKFVQYDFSQTDELELAYAITIHKSQGSEYKTVLLPIFSGPPMFMTRNLLYTALTRAKKIAVIIGSPKTVHLMISNKQKFSRFSALSYRIKNLSLVNPELSRNRDDLS